MSGYVLILWYFEQGIAMLGWLKVGYYLVHHHEPATNATLVLAGGGGGGGAGGERTCLYILVFRTR